MQVVNLTWLNRRKAAERVRKGLPAYPHDVSMDLKYRGDDADADVVVDGVERAPEVPDEDLTDKQNEMVSLLPFVCVVEQTLMRICLV